MKMGGVALEGKAVISGIEYSVRKVGTRGQKASGRVKGRQIIIRIPVHWQREEGFKAFLELKRKIALDIEKKPERFAKAEIDFIIRSAKLNRSFPIECKYGQPLSKSQGELLAEFAGANKTFAISTTPNSIGQKGERIEVPLWIMALSA